METSAQGHPHGAMRRKEREIKDRAEIDEILNRERVMHLALADNNIPFVVPVFYAYDGASLYFHSAKAGTKMEIIKRNDNVCFEISIFEGVAPSDAACNFEARHRTVIGCGKAALVEDDDEKTKALDLIVAAFTNEKFTYSKKNLERTQVVRIDIASVKGKKHGV